MKIMNIQAVIKEIEATEVAKNVAKKLLAACITGQTDVDWAEVDRLAALPDFAIVEELNLLKNEVQNEL